MAKYKTKAQKTSIQSTGNLDRYFEVMGEYPELFRNVGKDTPLNLVLDRHELEEEQANLIEENRMKGDLGHFDTLGVLAEDSFSLHLRDLVRYSDGMLVSHHRHIFKMDLCGGRMVFIVPYHDGNVRLVRHYFHDDRRWEWSLPHEYILPGEDMLTRAGHVLRSMMGLRFLELYPLFQRYDDNSVVLMAETTLVDAVEPDYTGDTVGERRWFTMVELEQAILTGMISSPAILAAFIHISRNGIGSSISTSGTEV